LGILGDEMRPKMLEMLSDGLKRSLFEEYCLLEIAKTVKNPLDWIA